MLKPVKQIGDLFVYGERDGPQDDQFLLMWGESGYTVTAVLLTGYYEGGGVYLGSTNLSMNAVEEILDTAKDAKEAKSRLDEMIRRIESVS